MLIKKQNTIFEDRIPTASDNLASKYSLGTRWINNLTGKQYRHITNGVWVLEISEVELHPLVDESHVQNTDNQLQSSNALHVVTLDNGGTLHVENISQSGSTYETHAEQIYTASDNIILRDGAVSGLATGEYVGLKAKLYDGINDGELVFDKDGWARVGDVGNTKKIATIEETPTDNAIGIWDGINFRFKTENKNSAFNKSFGTTTGTVLEGRTFGTAANNNTGDFLAYNGTAVNSSLLEGHNAAYFQTALGYTPYNATNPSGYISGINSSMVTTALGYTPWYSGSHPTTTSGYGLPDYPTTLPASDVYA